MTSPTKRAACALAFALGLFLSSSSARAQDHCPASDPALQAQSPEERLEAIREVMRHQAVRGKTWTIAWEAIGAALGAEAWVEFPFVDANKRVAQGLVALAPAYIPLSLFLFPLRVTDDRERLETYLTLTSSSAGPIGPCLRLERAEELLADAAEDEAWHTNIGQHITTIVLSAAYTAVLQIAFHDPKYTWLDGAGSVVVGEVQLLTAPTGAVEALAKYKKGDLVGARRSASAAPSLSIGPMGLAPGLSLIARF